MGIISELRRREVLKTLAFFVAGSWILIQASDLFFPGWCIPESSIRHVWVAVLMGLPVALLFSWTFDIRRAGVRRTLSAGRNVTSRAMVKSDVVLLSALSLVSLGIILVQGQAIVATKNCGPVASHPAVFDPPAGSIAVLPFANAGSDDDSSYFAEGVAYTLLGELSKVQNLVVRARDSSFSLRDPSMDATTKARRLNAAFLLDGSVQSVGDSLRIIVWLVDGTNGQSVWSETLDGTRDDVLDMQDEIAEWVLAEMENLSPVVPGRLVQRRISDNPAAVDYYWRGRHALDYASPEALDRSIAAFDQAIELDEAFALAYIGRANARALREGMVGFGFFGDPMPNQDPIQNDWFDYVYPLRTREIGTQLEQLIGPDIEKALELAPGLAEAQAAYGLLLLRMRDLDLAETALKNALEINPNFAFARAMLGMLYWEINLYDLAIEHLDVALALDPLSVPVRVYLANALMYTRDRERAITVFESLRAMAPERWAWTFIRYPLFHEGQYVDLVELSLEVAADPAWVYGVPWAVEWTYIYLGDIAGARRIEQVRSEYNWQLRTVNGRLTLSEQERARRGPIDSYKAEEHAAIVRAHWVYLDQSFQDAYDHLIQIMARVPEGVPISPMARAYAARYALVLGNCKAAREQFELAGKDLAPLDWPYSNIYMDSLFAYVDAIDYATALRCLGDEEKAKALIDGTLEWLDEMEANGYGVSQIPVVRAQAHALRGESNEALDLLERYAALPGPVLSGIKNYPALKSLEEDPRFQSVVATIKEKNRAILEQVNRAVEESGLEF